MDGVERSRLTPTPTLGEAPPGRDAAASPRSREGRAAAAALTATAPNEGVRPAAGSRVVSVSDGGGHRLRAAVGGGSRHLPRDDVVPVEGSSAGGALSGDGTSITSCAMLKGGLRRT